MTKRTKRFCLLFLLFLMAGFFTSSLTSTVLAQGGLITVHGVVSNAQGAVQGASVNVEGSPNGVATSETGTFTIQAPSNAVLIFSLVGHATQRVLISNRTEISV